MENNSYKNGVVSTHALYVRKGPGKDFELVEEKPIIREGDHLDILHTEEDAEGEKWFSVIIDDSILGFVKSKYITIE